MAIEILATKPFEQALRKYPHPNIVHKSVRLLVDNPWHPSLNRHPYKGARKGIWECYTNSGDRILYEIKDSELRLWYFGPHSMLDRARQFNFSEDKAFARYNLPLQPSASPVQKSPESLSEAPFVPPFNAEKLLQPSQDSREETAIQEPLMIDEAVEASELLQPTQVNPFSFFEDAHLRLLGVPADLVQALKNAVSLDEALALPGLAEDVVQRLMEAYTSPELHQSMFDESLLVFRTTLDRFESFCGGKISQLMLNLDPTQQRYVDMEKVSIILLKGSAGSGKTAIGIHRAIRLAEQGRRVLLLTFSNALSSSTAALVKSLTGPLPPNLDVRTLHSQAGQILHQHIGDLIIDEDGQRVRRILQQALDEVKPNLTSVFMRDAAFFEDEIKYVIKGLGIKSLEEYKQVERAGRKVALQASHREVVWKVYSLYQQYLEQDGILEWSDIVLQTLDFLQKEPLIDTFDDIIVDEAQDLTPVDMQVIQRLVKQVDSGDRQSSIMILADTAQTLYSRYLPWKQAGIEVKARTVTQRKNYRSTRQIAEAATQLLAQNTLMREEYVDPEWSKRQGILPIVVKMPSIPHQMNWIAECISDLLRDGLFRLTDFAVLCRTNAQCQECQSVLENRGLKTTMRNQKHFKLLEDGIKILTLHSSKGLEFPVVFIIGLVEALFPWLNQYRRDDEEVQQEHIEKERRLCYVGMTRAVDGLYLLTVENERNQSRFVHELAGKVIYW